MLEGGCDASLPASEGSEGGRGLQRVGRGTELGWTLGDKHTNPRVYPCLRDGGRQAVYGCLVGKHAILQLRLQLSRTRHISSDSCQVGWQGLHEESIVVPAAAVVPGGLGDSEGGAIRVGGRHG